MKNQIEERIDEEVKYLLGKRNTGRSSRLVDEVIESLLEGSGKNLVVLGQNQFVANLLCKMTGDKLSESGTQYITRVGGGIQVGENLVIFRAESFMDNPCFKYQKWDGVFEDNSIADQRAMKRIEFLKSELSVDYSRSKISL